MRVVVAPQGFGVLAPFAFTCSEKFYFFVLPSPHTMPDSGKGIFSMIFDQEDERMLDHETPDNREGACSSFVDQDGEALYDQSSQDTLDAFNFTRFCGSGWTSVHSAWG